MAKKSRQYFTIPNLFTTINLFCGFVSIAATMSGKFATAGWVIFFAGIFDALDGKIARFSGQHSDFGLQMDSLADVISAGAAPAILLYEYHLKSVGHHFAVGLILGFLPLLFATFRLARFNVMMLREGHQSYFTGMPAPMAASTLASLVVLHSLVEWPILLRGMIVMTPAVSLAMASHLRYESFPRFSLKERGGNRFKLLMFFAGIVNVFIFPAYTFFIFMMVYFLSGPMIFFYSLFKTSHNTRSALLEDDDIFADQRVP
jgi:CDP-diacylglycerol--serine O-phosphatidyltransferase